MSWVQCGTRSSNLQLRRVGRVVGRTGCCKSCSVRFEKLQFHLEAEWVVVVVVMLKWECVETGEIGEN